MMNKKFQWAAWVVIAALLLALPAVGIYYTNMFVSFAIFAVFSLSLNMLLGFTGLLSFGHAMYFAAGGYGTALALKHIEGLPLLPAVGCGMLAAIALATLVSPIFVRVRDSAFSMLHMAFSQVILVLILKLRNITGGEDGIGNFPTPALSVPGIFSFPIKNNPQNFYYFALFVLGLSAWLMWFFTKTPFGQIQIGIRDNTKRIGYLGFHVTKAKAVIYISAAMFAGIAGSMYGLFHNLVSAEGSAGVLTSFTPIINTMVGGVGSFFGPIYGTAIMQLLEEMLLRITDRVELVMGVILVLVVMFAPGGLAFMLQKAKQKWFTRPAAGAGKAAWVASTAKEKLEETT